MCCTYSKAVKHTSESYIKTCCSLKSDYTSNLLRPDLQQDVLKPKKCPEISTSHNLVNLDQLTSHTQTFTPSCPLIDSHVLWNKTTLPSNNLWCELNCVYSGFEFRTVPGPRSSQRETDAVNLTMREREMEWERETWTTQRLWRKTKLGGEQSQVWSHWRLDFWKLLCSSRLPKVKKAERF